MNAPQKPSERQVPRQKPVALQSPALELTSAELAVIMAFRQLNNRGQELVSEFVPNIVTTYPKRPASRLRLVIGGAA